LGASARRSAEWGKLRCAEEEAMSGHGRLTGGGGEGWVQGMGTGVSGGIDWALTETAFFGRGRAMN